MFRRRGLFTDVAKYDENGNEIVYTVKEQAVANHLEKYKGGVAGFVITNTYNPTVTPEPERERINIPVTKVWLGDVRTDSVTIELHANNMATQSLTSRYVSSGGGGGGGWTLTPELEPTPEPEPEPTPNPVLETDTETDSGLDNENDQNNSGTEEDSENSEWNNSGNQNNTGNNVGQGNGTMPNYNYSRIPARTYYTGTYQSRLPQTDGTSTNAFVWLGGIPSITSNYLLCTSYVKR